MLKEMLDTFKVVLVDPIQLFDSVDRSILDEETCALLSKSSYSILS